MSDAEFRSTAYRYGRPGFGFFSPRGGQPRLPGRRGLSGVLLGLIGLALLPSIEIAAFFVVAGWIGLPAALLAFVLTSFLGVALLRQQGGTAIRRVAQAVRRGQRPEEPMRNGLWFALGAVLMILPGFVTDALGFGLMLPTLLRSWGESAGERAPQPGAFGPRPFAPGVQHPRQKPEDDIVDLSAAEWRTVSEGPARR